MPFHHAWPNKQSGKPQSLTHAPLMAARQSKSRSTKRHRCDGEPEQLYQRVIRRKLDLGRTGFAGRRPRECCHRLQEQVLARTRRPLLSVLRQSCGPSEIGLLIEEQVVITKVPLVHLSVKIHLPQTKPPSPEIHANRLD